MTEEIPKTKLEQLYFWIQKTDTPALVGLVAANLLPLILTVMFGWELASIVILYWWENLITGFFAILRIIGASGDGDGNKGAKAHGEKVFLVPFFCFHYFFFCFVHGIFVLILTSGDSFGSGPTPGNFLASFWSAVPEWGTISLVAIFASHGISFWRNYIVGGEYKKTSCFSELVRPYGRIVLLHVCIIAGGFVMMAFGAPMFMVLLLIIGKTIMDAGLHVVMHRTKAKDE